MNAALLFCGLLVHRRGPLDRLTARAMEPKVHMRPSVCVCVCGGA